MTEDYNIDANLHSGSANDYRNYGKTLADLLNEIGLSAYNLSVMLGMKSRTTVSRVLHDECRFDTVSLFHENLIQVVELTPKQLADLERALEITRDGLPKYTAKKRLELIFTHPYATDSRCLDSKCVAAFGNAESGMRFTDYLEGLSKWENVSICLSNPNEVMCLAIERYIEHGGGSTVEIFLNRSLDSAGTIMKFVDVLPLITIKGSKFYIEDRFDYSEKDAAKQRLFGGGQRQIYVFKKRGNDENQVDILNFDYNDNFNGVFGLRDSALIAYLEHYFSEIRQSRLPFGAKFLTGSTAESFIDASEWFAQAERAWDSILIKPFVCVNAIDPDIMIDLIADAGYLGMPRDSYPIRRLINIQRGRYDNFTDESRHETLVISRSGIDGFVEKGMESDHPVGLRAFTPSERLSIINNLIGMCERVKSFYLFVLNDDIGSTDYMMRMGGSDTLCIANVNIDYSDCHEICFFKGEPFIGLVREFILDVLIKKHCYTAADSIKILQKAAERLRSMLADTD